MPTIEKSGATKERMEHLAPIDTYNPSTPQRPAPEPVYPSYPRFLVTSLPLSVTYQPDALRQFYRGGIPQSRIIPTQQ